MRTKRIKRTKLRNWVKELLACAGMVFVGVALTLAIVFIQIPIIQIFTCVALSISGMAWAYIMDYINGGLE